MIERNFCDLTRRLEKSDFISSVSCRFRGRPKIFHLNVEDNVETEIKKMMLSTVVFFC